MVVGYMNVYYCILFGYDMVQSLRTYLGYISQQYLI